MQDQKVYRLKGQVQHYAWGGYEFIPSLLHIANEAHKPFAEYWMGAHPLVPSTLLDGQTEISLAQLIKEDPEKALGKKVAERFGELPYLLKVLDVNEMLSIQVHPSKKEAEKGFDAEEAAGVAINAPNRNYKDRNHKPEVMVALSEFWLLHGFKQKEQIERTLEDVAEFNSLIAIFRRYGTQGLYQFLMEMSQEDVDVLLVPVVKRALRRKREGGLTEDQADWWVNKYYEHQPELQQIDRGIFSIYLFNIVKLHPGEAIFQGAGVPHAYLEGQNVELMANSDNVLRGGLTPKHVDVVELMKHTSFESVTPQILKGEPLGNGEKNYPCPVKDFGITRIELPQGASYSSSANSFEILLVMEGAILLNGETNALIKKGEALAILAGGDYQFTATGQSTIYKAYVPA